MKSKTFEVVLTASLGLRLHQSFLDVLVGRESVVVGEVRYSDVVLSQHLPYRLGRVQPEIPKQNNSEWFQMDHFDAI